MITDIAGEMSGVSTKEGVCGAGREDRRINVIRTQRLIDHENGHARQDLDETGERDMATEIGRQNGRQTHGIDRRHTVPTRITIRIIVPTRPPFG